MKIQQKILDDISVISNGNSSEIGGVLGSSKTGIITDMVSDLYLGTVHCRFEYHPNTDYLNSRIAKWAENGIEFLGFFHTHFSGSTNLSDADIKYIESIMLNCKGIIDYLYFPIFTLPDNKLTVFKAYFNDKEIVIANDELIIV